MLNDIDQKLISISADLLSLGVVLDSGACKPEDPNRPAEHIVAEALLLGRHSDRLYVAVRNYVILKGTGLDFVAMTEWIASSHYSEDDRRAALRCLSGLHKKASGDYLPAIDGGQAPIDYPSRGFLSNTPNLDQDMLGAGLRVLRNKNEGEDRYLGPDLIAEKRRG